MNRILTIGLAALLAWAATQVASLGQAPAKTSGVLSVLKPGQSVSLGEAPGGYQITFFDGENEKLSHEVVELGSDFVVVRDITKVQETRIPLWSLKSIKVISQNAGIK